MNNLKNLLFNPDSFFREKSRNETSFKYPLLIILVNAVFAIGSSFLTMSKFGELFPSDTGSYLSVITISISVIGGVIGAFLYWFILTGILYLISSSFNSKGSFTRTLEFVGYGYVPTIFSRFINFVVMYKLLASVDFSSQDLQLITQGVEQMFSNNPLFYISQIIGILCLLLSAYIWIFALSHARNMSFKNATLTVGIPVGLFLVYQVYLFLFTSGSI